LGDALTDKAIAVIVANELGADVSDVFTPPIIGRVLELGPIKSRGGIPYRTFTLVNENERFFCVAFGEEHVNTLEIEENYPIRIRKYVKAIVRGAEIIRVTENSKLETLPEDALPPVFKLAPAVAPTLAAAQKSRGLG